MFATTIIAFVLIATVEQPAQSEMHKAYEHAASLVQQIEDPDTLISVATKENGVDLESLREQFLLTSEVRETLSKVPIGGVVLRNDRGHDASIISSQLGASLLAVSLIEVKYFGRQEMWNEMIEAYGRALTHVNNMYLVAAFGPLWACGIEYRYLHRELIGYLMSLTPAHRHQIRNVLRRVGAPPIRTTVLANIDYIIATRGMLTRVPRNKWEDLGAKIFRDRLNGELAELGVDVEHGDGGRQQVLDSLSQVVKCLGVMACTLETLDVEHMICQASFLHQYIDDTRWKLAGEYLIPYPRMILETRKAQLARGVADAALRLADQGADFEADNGRIAVFRKGGGVWIGVSPTSKACAHCYYQEDLDPPSYRLE